MKNRPGFEDKRMLLSQETLLGIRITSEYVHRYNNNIEYPLYSSLISKIGAVHIHPAWGKVFF